MIVLPCLQLAVLLLPYEVAFLNHGDSMILSYENPVLTFIIIAINSYGCIIIQKLFWTIENASNYFLTQHVHGSFASDES